MCIENIISTPVFAGIIKAVGDDLVAAATDALPMCGGVPLKENKHGIRPWHVTLIHQSLLKPHRKALKKMDLQALPAIRFLPDIHHRMAEGPNGEPRESWVLWVDDETQEALAAWVESLLTELGVEEREKRSFHLSVSNLTGLPGDSVR